jgi:hypothetical protein
VISAPNRQRWSGRPRCRIFQRSTGARDNVPTLRFYRRTNSTLNGAGALPAGNLSLSESAPDQTDAAAPSIAGGHLSTTTGAASCQLNKPTTKDNTTVAGSTPPTISPPAVAHQFGWWSDRRYNGTIDLGTYVNRWREDDSQVGITGNNVLVIHANRTRDFGGMMRFVTTLTGATDWWAGAVNSNSWTSSSLGPFQLQNEYIFLQSWCVETAGFVSGQTLTEHQEGSDLVDATRSNLLSPNFTPAVYHSDQMAFGKGYGLG